MSGMTPFDLDVHSGKSVKKSTYARLLDALEYIGNSGICLQKTKSSCKGNTEYISSKSGHEFGGNENRDFDFKFRHLQRSNYEREFPCG